MISAFGIEHGELSKNVSSNVSNARQGYRIARTVGAKGKTDQYVREHLSNFKGANAGYHIGQNRNAYAASGAGVATVGGGAAAYRKKRKNAY